MLSRKIILTFIAIAAIAGFFFTPFYRHWLQEKFANEAPRIGFQMRHLDEEERYEDRFGEVYILQRALKARLEHINARNVLILLPPQSYIDANRRGEPVIIPEPAVFYYFTGYRAVVKSSIEARQATWALLVADNKIVLGRMPNTHYRDSILNILNQYQ